MDTPGITYYLRGVACARNNTRHCVDLISIEGRHLIRFDYLQFVFNEFNQSTPFSKGMRFKRFPYMEAAPFFVCKIDDRAH